MAWSSADISASELTLAAADKPILVGVQGLESPTTARWDTNGSLADGSDQAESGYPSRWAYDRRSGKRTKPASSILSTWYFACDRGSTLQDFDCVFIVDTTFYNYGTTVTIQIADDNAFSSNLKTIATWSTIVSHTKRRHAELALNHTGSGSSNAQRYSNVRYLRMVMAGTFGTEVPAFGELWLGRRRQMKHKGNTPFYGTADYMQGSQRNFNTGAGENLSAVRYYGQRVIDLNFNPSEDTYHTNVRSWFRDCGWGTRSFIYVEDPHTYPERFNVAKLDDPKLAYALVTGNAEHEFSLRATEQGPSFLDVELNT